jgi:hypothetical protein
MMYNIADYSVVAICPSSNIIKTQRFGNWICFQNFMFCIILNDGRKNSNHYSQSLWLGHIIKVKLSLLQAMEAHRVVRR